MSLSNYGTNNAVAVKVWSRKLFTEALKATWAQKFMGPEDTNVVQILDDLKKGPGDRITVPLRLQLTSPGVQGDGTLEGNEEALQIYTDNVFIDQFRHAVRSAGKMSEQRIPFKVREQAYNGLKDYFAGRIDFWFFNQLAGNTAQTDFRYTGLQTPIAPDTNHRIWAGAVSADESLGSSNIMNLNLIDKAVERAKTLDQSTSLGLVPIRPLMIGGKPMYVLFLHPYQTYDIRTSTSTGQWLDIQKAAMTGGQVNNNPIFNGSIGMYNGVIMHEDYRLPLGVNSTTAATVASTRRAVFAGCQAGVMAIGQNSQPNKMSWVEELFDYKNQLGVSAGMIAGIKKLQFNAFDFGCVTISTYAAQHN